MLQYYSGHGSQYWASSGFLGLILPPDSSRVDGHRVADAGRARRFLRGHAGAGLRRPRHPRRRHRQGGEPSERPLSAAAAAAAQAQEGGRQAHPGDQGRRPASRRAGPTMPTIGSSRTRPTRRRSSAGSAMRATSTRRSPWSGTSGVATRRVKIHPIAAADRFAASAFYPDEPDWSERIETVSIARGAAEVRVHHVTARRPARVRDGGFAVADDVPLRTAAGEGWSRAWRRDGLTTFIGGLHGFAASDVQPSDGTNPFGEYSATPYLTSEPLRSAEAIFVSLVVLAGGAPDVTEALADIARVEVSGRQVTITCRDGERFYVHMVAPERVDRALGTLSARGPCPLCAGLAGRDGLRPQELTDRLRRSTPPGRCTRARSRTAGDGRRRPLVRSPPPTSCGARRRRSRRG